MEVRVMKKNVCEKASKYFALVMALICMVSLLAGCEVYSGEWQEYGDFTLKYKSNNKRYAMVAEWKWDGDLDNTIIEIPDECEKTVIEAMGGPLGTNAPMKSFQIKSDCELRFQGTDPEKYKDVEVSFDEVVFTLKIGKNIKKVHMNYRDREDDEYNWVAIENNDGSVTFYRIYFEVECDDENKTFYSKDGKLYQKKDNAKVKGLVYRSDAE